MLPILPAGLGILSFGWASEVSTLLSIPIHIPEIHLGDPFFFQHVKAGELCERFDMLYLIRGGKIEGTIATYSGEGRNFL